MTGNKLPENTFRADLASNTESPVHCIGMAFRVKTWVR